MQVMIYNPYEWIPRSEVMAMIGYKSLFGFNSFLKDNPDFPKPVRRTSSFNSRVYYLRSQVKAWSEKRLKTDISRGYDPDFVEFKEMKKQKEIPEEEKHYFFDPEIDRVEGI